MGHVNKCKKSWKEFNQNTLNKQKQHFSIGGGEKDNNDMGHISVQFCGKGRIRKAKLLRKDDKGRHRLCGALQVLASHHDEQIS